MGYLSTSSADPLPTCPLYTQYPHPPTFLYALLQYKMGYFEDTDFAMSVRAAGLKVLLQPLAVVYHQEGTTFGTDATSDLKRQLMAENRRKFLRKWSDVLQVCARGTLGARGGG